MSLSILFKVSFMKTFIPFALLLMVLTSCNSTFFQNAQPHNTKDQKSIPQNLMGAYVNGKTTLKIETNSITLNNKKYDIGRDLVLRSEGRYHYANLKRSVNGNTYWKVMIISQNDKDLNIWELKDVNSSTENIQYSDMYENGNKFKLVAATQDGFEQISNQVMSSKNPSIFKRL